MSEQRLSDSLTSFKLPRAERHMWSASQAHVAVASPVISFVRLPPQVARQRTVEGEMRLHLRALTPSHVLQGYWLQSP